MPRMQPVLVTDAVGASKRLLEATQRRLGLVPNLVKTLAHSPVALGAYIAFGDALDQALSPPLREQIALTVAGANACSYCASAHTALGARAGIASEEMTANLRGESADTKTRVALQFVRSVVATRGLVPDGDLERVRRAGFSDGQIAEIVALIALNVFTNYFNQIAATTIDFPLVDAKLDAIPVDRASAAN